MSSWECDECGMRFDDEPDLCTDCLSQSFSRVGGAPSNDESNPESPSQTNSLGDSGVYDTNYLSLLSDPPVVIGVLVVIVIVAVGVFGVGGGFGAGDGDLGEIEHSSDCEVEVVSSNQGEIECAHTVENEGSTVRGGELAVQYEHGGDIVQQEQFDLSGMSGGEREVFHTSYRGDSDAIGDIDVNVEFVDVNWYS